MPVISEQKVCEQLGYSGSQCDQYLQDAAKSVERTALLCKITFDDPDLNAQCQSYCNQQASSGVEACVGRLVELRQTEQQRHHESRNLTIALGVIGGIALALAWLLIRSRRRANTLI